MTGSGLRLAPSAGADRRALCAEPGGGPGASWGAAVPHRGPGALSARGGADLGTNPQEGLTLDRFTTIRKARFYLDQEHSPEADRYAGRLHAVSEQDDGTDLVVEVKAWNRELTVAAATPFIEAKESLGSHLGQKTAFLFYSESGLGQEAAAMLERAGIMIVEVAKLAGYEMPALSEAGPAGPFLE